MRLHLGAVPVEAGFDPETDGWRPIHEPGPWSMQLMATPVAALTVWLLWLLLIHVVIPANLQNPGQGIGIDVTTPTQLLLILVAILVGILFTVVVTMIAHELIHVLFCPGWGMTEHTILGCWPSRLLFYAFHNGTMPCWQMLGVGIAPFLVLSLGPMGLLAIWLRVAPNDIALASLAGLSLFNGMCSCGDILAFFIILFQIPIRSTTRNHGWSTYWKPASPVA